MALWGNKDDIFSPGSVTVDYSNLTITGSGTSFLAASVGDVISIGAGKTFGEAVISEITSEMLLSIGSTGTLSGSAIVNVSAYTISQKPKFTLLDSNYTANEIYGADENEVESSTFLTHAGWVGITTYLDNEGELRIKSEVLVAMSGISTGETTYSSPGDANDDVTLPDAIITIVTQPESVGIASTELPEDVVFTVSATVIPSSTNLEYQWQDNDGGGFDDLVGETGTSVSIANTDLTKNGYEYRVVITSSGGDTTLISDPAGLIII